MVKDVTSSPSMPLPARQWSKENRDSKPRCIFEKGHLRPAHLTKLIIRHDIKWIELGLGVLFPLGPHALCQWDGKYFWVKPGRTIDASDI